MIVGSYLAITYTPPLLFFQNSDGLLIFAVLPPAINNPNSHVWLIIMKTKNVISLPTLILSLIVICSDVIAGQIEKLILPDDSLQTVVVTIPNLNASTGTIELFERESPFVPWQVVGQSEKIVIGKNGLAWAPHLYVSGYKVPLKQEGDKKTPAGLFYLNSVFGYAPASKMMHLKMPYLHATENKVCIDDINSRFYNNIVDLSVVRNKDWKSYEKMRRHDDLYRLGVVVDYNTSPTIKGNGSCIFLHIWRGSQKLTAGCTAMATKVMKKLVSWLEIEKKPILIQLPQKEFERMNKNWCLPATDLNKQICQGKTNEDINNIHHIPGLYPEASTRQLTTADLSPLSKWQLKIMRNEIFARHGYIFKTQVMKKYFHATPWYHPQFDDVSHLLTPIERYNIKLIQQYK